ncbi:PQQ-dependent sugar dehydrogenase [Deinococcus peraridilitoris]|uniref:PQQ-dependent sugar dehydrogenase n=1 Tax=Deinococcus peraridilitoris TaxID=432329 RepID=UPI0012FB5DE1|nr:PQQ-dependent sugar dehydrogenase [Deinococcus peraridilitoris]
MPNSPQGMQQVNLEVPGGMGDAKVSASRRLTVPSGFSIQVVARVAGARFMAVAPNGDVLVSQPGAGTIVRLVVKPGQAAQQNVFVSGLVMPHDMVFATVAGTTYLYVAVHDKVVRYAYTNGMIQASAAQTVVEGLPTGSSEDLRGSYAHYLKNIVISPDGSKLYVSVASETNADPKIDRPAMEGGSGVERGAIYEFNAAALGQKIAANAQPYARGVRNAEGLAFAPNSNDLWIAVMNRDDVRCPKGIDCTGDGKPDDGALIQSYVDKNPPDLIVKVKPGADYGWPYCNADPRAGVNNMPYLNDFENNADGKKFNCATAERATKGLGAHEAPLGLTFWRNGPAEFRNVMTVGLHGCWNCSTYVGYKVSYFPVNGGTIGAQRDLVTGWVTDTMNPGRKNCSEVQDKCWGRPVDMADMPDGSLLISDDYTGTIYRLYKK